MSTSPINNFSNSYVQSVLNSALQNAGLNTNQNNSILSGVSTSPLSDNGQLSPFAQVLSTLQQLQQSNPTQYQQVTQEIATNLQTAAQTATSQGNTSAANQLNQLASDFTSASQNGQLPNIQDLAKAIGGGGHHHHHHSHGASSSSDSDSSATDTSSSSSSSTGSQSLSQLLASFQSSGSQSDSLNPLNIILSTLNSAGITGTNS